MSDEPELTPGQVGAGFLRHAQTPRNLGEAIADYYARATLVGRRPAAEAERT
jgi:hypothetical protein